MGKIQYNLTTNFALPLLGWQKRMFEPYLVNAYVAHEGLEHFQENHLFVLLEETMEEKYKKIEDILVKHKSHVSQYYVDKDERFVMHVFKYTDEMLPDYALFYEGKYSRMSPKAKTLVQASAKPNGVNYKILERHKSLAELQEDKIGETLDEGAEVWSSIHDKHNIIKEVFTDAVFEEIQTVY